jgi:hypothetical protein
MGHGQFLKSALSFFQVLVYKRMLSLKIGCSTYNDIKSIMHLQYTIQTGANLFGFHASLCVCLSVYRENQPKSLMNMYEYIKESYVEHTHAHIQTHKYIYI